jgi:hypothetical protein
MSSSQPEFLGSESLRDETTGSGRGGRRAGLIAGVALATVAAVGAGAYGVTQLMAGGDSPASAVPANAIAYASLDLDPSAAQKIEAIKIMRKFPGLREELDLTSRDDLRRAVFRELQEDGTCRSLSYADDVEPWIGNRIALAAVPGSGGSAEAVKPLVALQVTDQDKAKRGIEAIQKCADDGGSIGIASSGDYVLVSEKQADADAMAESADSSSLADDADFTTWMDRTGDPGIISMYAAAEAADVALDQAERAGGRMGSRSPGPAQTQQLEAAFKDFQGAAGVVRFDDGAVEAEFSSKGLGKGVGGTAEGGPDVATLPGTTAAVLSVALQDGWLDEGMDSLRSMLGEELDTALAQAEQQTGLTLPEDAETLLGDGFSISVDSSLDVQGLSSSPDPTEIPAGIRITGDAAKITDVIDKLKAAAGPQADAVQVRSKGNLVTVGLDKAYVETLLEDGDLGDSAAFRRVVPEAGRAGAVLYLSFDAGGGWAEKLSDDAEVKANVKPLDAFGVSSWQDDDQVQHALLRLTTD